MHRIIELFGPDRCMMASNFPVDHNSKWPADRLFPALLGLASRYDEQTQRKLFGGTALKVYTSGASASSEPIDFVDPHFHVWDITDDGVHDGKILFAPEGKKDFRAEDYEKMMTSKTKGNTTQGVAHT